ncbi:cell division inhibitor SepF [Microcella putealis]|uniref:Cell division protein SepF n=1 Tax=Microcella putealis TaxID=337005 RepID=A0A4Q7LID3_9MICO|nr:cell division protein SepF [Microcella putealis]RZS54325.1 cell division inhibitor SepF [Microcella putealis]TQM24921.1 cell division inhibitor SepF [Microcella putealis]
MSNPLRKTMVYLGLADEEVQYDDRAEAPASPAPAAAAAAPTASAPQKAPVTPLRRAASVRPAAAAPDMNEILTVHPRHYKDAAIIAESFREGIPVIINLTQMTESEARRLVDFASGLSQGLYGKIERVTAKVFLLSPAHVAVSGESAEPESDVDASFDGRE